MCRYIITFLTKPPDTKLCTEYGTKIIRYISQMVDWITEKYERITDPQGVQA